jgi:hypothetical protein
MIFLMAEILTFPLSIVFGKLLASYALPSRVQGAAKETKFRAKFA